MVDMQISGDGEDMILFKIHIISLVVFIIPMDQDLLLDSATEIIGLIDITILIDLMIIMEITLEEVILDHTEPQQLELIQEEARDPIEIQTHA